MGREVISFPPPSPLLKKTSDLHSGSPGVLTRTSRSPVSTLKFGLFFLPFLWSSQWLRLQETRTVVILLLLPFVLFLHSEDRIQYMNRVTIKGRNVEGAREETKCPRINCNVSQDIRSLLSIIFSRLCQWQ